jgi:hypothetical protein
MELRFSINSIAIQIVGNPEIEYFIKFEMKGLKTLIRIEDNSDTQVDFSVDSFMIKNGENCVNTESQHYVDGAVSIPILNRIMSSPIQDVFDFPENSSN